MKLSSQIITPLSVEEHFFVYYLVPFYIICAVLNSTRSTNIKVYVFKNSVLVYSLYPKLFTILMALFCSMHTGCRVLL